MNDFDKDMKKALSQTNGADYNGEQENILREMIAVSFKGKSKFITIVTWADMIVFLGIAIFSAVKFFDAGDVRNQIFYATVFLLSSMVMSLVKLWWWTMAHRTAIQRDIKRVEMRLVEFIEKQTAAE